MIFIYDRLFMLFYLQIN